VGFASGFGAYAVEEATVQRLDRSGISRLAPESTLALDLREATREPLDSFINHTLNNVATAPHGTLVIVVPESLIDPAERDGGTSDSDLSYDSCAEALRRTAGLLTRRRLPQAVVLALPASTKPPYASALETEFASLLGQPISSTRHQRGPRPENAPASIDRAWILFVDPHGAIRWAGPLFASQQESDPGLDHWLTVFGRRSE
jgi:hypothetical protein